MMEPFPFATPRRAWVRAVSDRYADALRTTAEVLEVDRARAQHAAYVQALTDAGVEVCWISPAHDAPDAVFVEDQAVLVRPGSAFATQVRAESRRAEATGVRRALSERLELTLQDLGHLDGGDVLRVGARWFVGLSSRTDADGIESLRRCIGGTVTTVPVRDGLHLKSGVTLAGPGRVVLDPRAVDPGPFRNAGLEVWETVEPFAANVLCFADRVLVSSAAPRIAERLGRDTRVVLLEASEFHKADGALTCLSLRESPTACWCS